MSFTSTAWVWAIELPAQASFIKLNAKAKNHYLPLQKWWF